MSKIDDNKVETEEKPSIKYSSPSDKVVSEVNPFLVTSTEHKSQNASNIIAKISFSVPKSLIKNCPQVPEKRLEQKGIVLDDDGDLVLSRDPKIENNAQELHILIEYENATTLDLVGLQIWRGAFLLSDFAIHFASQYFQGKNVLELGAGTGLVGIVASLFANKVVLTDLNEPSIMNLLKSNISLNQHLLAQKSVQVLPLDFLSLNWSQELTEAASLSDVIIAADVIYHVDITTALVHTILKLFTCSIRPKDIFIALEKRYIFTFSELESVSPMHNHFLEEMDNLLNLSPGALPRPLCTPEGNPTSLKISMSLLPLNFQQYFNYERCKELVLYHIKIYE